MLQSEQLKQKHNKLAAEIRSLDALENPTAEQSKQAADKFTELRALGEKITRQLELEKLVDKGDQNHIPSKELKKYSLSKALQFFTGKPLEGRERECHEELLKHTPRKADGQLLVPLEILLPKPKIERRAIGTESSLISDPLREDMFQFALRELPILDRLGVRRISASQSFNYPKATATTSNWFTGTGSDSSATTAQKIAESDMDFSSESVVPSYLSTRSGMTWDILQQIGNSLDLEQKIRMDMMMSINEKLNKTLIDGDRSARAAEPSGLIKLLSGTNETAIALKKVDPNAREWLWQDFLDLRRRFREKYKNNQSSPVLLFSPLIESELGGIQRFSGTDGRSILEALPPHVVSNHMPDTRLFYGQFSEFIFVNWGGISLEKGYLGTDFETATTRIRAILSASFVLDRSEGFQQLSISRA